MLRTQPSRRRARGAGPAAAVGWSARQLGRGQGGAAGLSTGRRAPGPEVRDAVEDVVECGCQRGGVAADLREQHPAFDRGQQHGRQAVGVRGAAQLAPVVHGLQAGGEHDDWDDYDQTMAQQRRTAVLIRPDRVYSNRN
nr:hypothetical protein [Mycolicibacterium aromaticivorans]